MFCTYVLMSVCNRCIINAVWWWFLGVDNIAYSISDFQGHSSFWRSGGRIFLLPLTCIVVLKTCVWCIAIGTFSSLAINCGRFYSFLCLHCKWYQLHYMQQTSDWAAGLFVEFKVDTPGLLAVDDQCEVCVCTTAITHAVYITPASETNGLQLQYDGPLSITDSDGSWKFEGL